MSVRRDPRVALGALLMFFVALSLPFTSASGATFTVANTSDSGPGSLRQAVLDASSAAGADTVVIPSGLGTITLVSTIQFSGSDLTTVQGNGNTISYAAGTAFNSGGTTPYALNTLTINADQGANTLNGSLAISSSTLNVTNQGANTMDGSMSISNTTINSDGGGVNTMDGPISVVDSTINFDYTTGINSSGGNVTVTGSTLRSSSDGSGVNTSSGSITLTDSLIDTLGEGVTTSVGAISLTDSEVRSGDEGVYSSGTAVSLTRSSVIGQGADPDYGVYGIESVVTLVNSTVTGFNESGVVGMDVTLVYSTVVESGTGEESGANVEAFTLETFGTVLSSSGVDCDVEEPVTSHGYNFSNDTSCGITSTGDVQSGGSAGLGAVADNGGGTRTMLPAAGSPLLNAIPLSSCQDNGASGITTDQRSLTRPSETGCEIGAVEVQVRQETTTTTSTSTSTTSTTTTAPTTTTTTAPTPIARNPNYTG